MSVVDDASVCIIIAITDDIQHVSCFVYVYGLEEDVSYLMYVPCSASRGRGRVGAAAPSRAGESGEGIGTLVQREHQGHSGQSVSPWHGCDFTTESLCCAMLCVVLLPLLLYCVVC